MGTIKNLKEYLEKLPKEFDEFEMVNGEVANLGDGDTSYYRVDKPIISINIDEENKEICFLHQTEEEIDKIVNKK